MKLIDAISKTWPVSPVKKRGSPLNVPRCSRDELPEFFRQMGYHVGAEIGVYKGQFTEKFCQEGLKMYAIDNWLVYHGGAENHQSQERQDFLYEKTKRRLSSYNDCTVIRKSSMDAVKDFKPESLDFVYLDGDHSFKGIAEDIYEWYRIVKKGGIVSGHDYSCVTAYCQVGTVVDAFVKAFGIKSYYVFGRSKPLEMEEKNDRYLSWMFLKP